METKLLKLGWELKGKGVYSKDSTVVVVGTQSVGVYTTTEGFRRVVEFDRKDARIKNSIPTACTGIAGLLSAGLALYDLKDILHMVGNERLSLGYRNYWHASGQEKNLDALVPLGWVDVQPNGKYLTYSASQKVLDMLGIVLQ